MLALNNNNISQESESTKLINQVLSMASKNLKCSAASLFLIEESTGDLYFEAVLGGATQSIIQIKPKVTKGIAHWVSTHGHPLIVNDVDNNPIFNKDIDHLTNFTTKSIICVPLMIEQKIIGAIEVLNKIDGSHFSNTDMEILTALASTASLAIENSQLHHMILEAYEATMNALASAIDAKDPYTLGHSNRVAEYAVMAANALNLSPSEVKTIKYAGILHDIGKIIVDEAILCKSGKLTDDEWAIIRSHPAIGASIIANIPFLRDAKEIITHHHERFDGSGYPDGLRGEEISIGARILTIADAFDTMTTDRSYQCALDIEAAINELIRCRGTQFCPVVLDAFLDSATKRRNKTKKNEGLGDLWK